LEGEAHRRGARGSETGARPRAQQERPGGGAGRSEAAARDHAGRNDRRSAGPRVARPDAARQRRARACLGREPAPRGASVSDFATLEAAFRELEKRDGRYHERAYLFVLAALEYAQGRLPARRHLSGGELAWACRDFALEQFGLLRSEERRVGKEWSARG